MNIDERFLKAFNKYLPTEAVPYCYELWKEKPFTFQITKERSTKLGDFRYHQNRRIQTITINHNLNPFQFLITFLHEVAHLHTYEAYGVKVKPHGIEWKIKFQDLMLPMCTEKVFPKDILIPLGKYMQNPKASTGTDHRLIKALRAYDSNRDNTLIFLMDLDTGSEFILRERKFIKKETKRTRILCEEVPSGNRYLISGRAEVFPVE
ncbi:SprT-like domain-containing protein [Mongoliitalea daihaiensis]|uniref:SprT-like domain-containing protein n=1 Tax=Mongoliitalea daihaiensis TaxID=2782006 RepID=UPI001F1E6CCA|nr:SprT-like domain-containing protein [Mongoliitalea daihaiensis]UJP65551.1 SprT-like domain-containing protein [Mongoliitalea daihaiensis]